MLNSAKELGSCSHVAIEKKKVISSYYQHQRRAHQPSTDQRDFGIVAITDNVRHGSREFPDG